MKSFLNSLFDNLIIVAPFILVFLVALETVLAITSATVPLAIFHACAAIFNGLVLYYAQIRANI